MNTNENVSMVAVDGMNDIVADLTSATTAFCSMKANTAEEKAKLFSAMNNPEKRLADCINEVIKVKDIYAEVVNCTNVETGEISKVPRIVLIDEKGVGYACVSIGIFGAVKKLMQIYGVPTWNTPIPLKVRQITKGAKKMLSLDVQN